MLKQFILLFFLCLLFIYFPLAKAETQQTKIVNLSLILFGQFNSTMQQPLLDWLQSINYHNWTIAIWIGHYNTILNNATFINQLKQYGELIPAVNSPSPQEVYPNERQAMLENCLNNWTTKIGYAPKGIFMYQPDTSFANLMLEYNLEYIQGYCFEQYEVVDNMGMRGGWQQPYYASSNHTLIPNNNVGGIVILPHNIWDWRASLEIDHHLNTHLQNAYRYFNNITIATEYALNLIDSTLNNMKPFGYVMVQHEWDWMYSIGFLGYLKNYVNAILSKDYTFQMCNETVTWFKNQYATTPEYSLTFNSPYDGKKVEWLYNTKYRITRYDSNKVVGYIQYEKQQPDPYLTTKAETIIKTSLTYTIDDFGNGNYRAPSQGNSVKYSGDLSNFPLYYASVYMPQQNILQFVPFILMIVLLSVALAKIKEAI